MPRQHQPEDAFVRKIAVSARSLRGVSSRLPVVLGIGDDAALFRPKHGYETILTCDWFLEGTHFLRDKHPPDSVGWKCLARALSDIAAMGGIARCFLLSLALPESPTGRWLDQFLKGLRRASRRFNCVLAGGDTTRRGEIMINVTVIGEVQRGRAVLRSGAREGDIVYVSGRLGEAELGLQLLKLSKKRADKQNPLLRKHLYPEPRLELGRWLAERKLATAMMDLSDGLSTDLNRLCLASGVGALIGTDDLPCTKPVRSRNGRKRLPTSTNLALHGGDDYELLFTAKRQSLPTRPWKFHGLSVHPIGHITSGPNVVVGEPHGRILSPSGWDPFRKKL